MSIDFFEGLNKEEIQSIRLLSDGSEVQIMDLWTVKNYPDIVFVNFDSSLTTFEAVAVLLSKSLLSIPVKFPKSVFSNKSLSVIL